MQDCRSRAMTKRVRIYNALAECQNTKRNCTHILEFIRFAMKPARYSREPHRYEPMRARLNLVRSTTD